MIKSLPNLDVLATPLSEQEKQSAGGTVAAKKIKQDDWLPVVPVPNGVTMPDMQHHAYGKPTEYWSYCDIEGNVQFYSVRYDSPGKRKQFLPYSYCQHNETGQYQWRCKWPPASRSLYGLNRLEPHPVLPILITEGEKSADAAICLLQSNVATTSSGGCKRAAQTDWGPVKGEKIVIWPDADNAGLEYAQEVARLALDAGASSVAIITPPAGVGEGWDAGDALAEGWTQDKVERLISEAVPFLSEGMISPEEMEAPTSQKDRCLWLAKREVVEFWHTENHEAGITVCVKGHFEHYLVRSDDFRAWMRHLYYQYFDSAPSKQAFTEACDTIEAISLHDGNLYPVFYRIGQYGDALYYNLANDTRQVVRITSDGWGVIPAEPHVKLLRHSYMQVQCLPERTGNIEVLHECINFGEEKLGERNFILTVGFLLKALDVTGPYPLLHVTAEQGSGKSEACKMLVSLIDPSSRPLRSKPKTEQDLVVIAKRNHLLCFDNLSSLSVDLSDALCRLATGGGFSARKLYSDDEESALSVCRPCIINGIYDNINRADLLDRTLPIQLPRLVEDKRRTSAALWQLFEHIKPQVLGGLFDALVAGLKHRDAIKSLQCGRMVDCLQLVTAAESVLGWEPDSFARAYAEACNEANLDNLFLHPLTLAIVRLVEKQSDSLLEPSRLLALLKQNATQEDVQDTAWPKSASHLSRSLNMLTPQLRRIGIKVEIRGKCMNGGRRGIRISQTKKFAATIATYNT